MRAEHVHEIKTVLGDDGLALVAAVAELAKKLAAGVPEGFGIRIDVDRLDEWRDDVRVGVSRRHRGEVEFILASDGEPVPISVNPNVF